MGGILENKVFLKNKIENYSDMVCVNPSDYGLVTLLRIYPKGVDARAQYYRELIDPNFREDLIKHNKLTQSIGNKLFEWFRSGKKINDQCTPYLSFTTGFRTAEYNRDMKDTEALIYAIKMFPMNVYITPEIMSHVLECIEAARDEVISEEKV